MIRGLVAVLAAWLAAASYLFLWPHDDLPPERADAVVVLAGSDDRLPVGQRLIREGVAPRLVLSTGAEVADFDPRLARICADPPALVECFEAEPFSTRGEARAIARLASRRGWNELVVVTSGFHVFRARRLVERCLDAELSMVGAPFEWYLLPLAMTMESLKLVRAETTQRGC